MENQGVNGAQTPGATEPNKTNQDDVTKVVAKRLAEMRNKDRSELAQALGFNSWEDAINSGLDKKLLDAGIDPEASKPIINNIVESHPDVIKARQLIAENERTKQNLEFAELKTKFGIEVSSLDELDENTKSLVAKGVPLSQAYVAIHYDELRSGTQSTTVQQQQVSARQHLGGLPGGSGTTPAVGRSVTQADIANVRRFMPQASEEQIKKFLEKHPEIK
ncbi:MAG: hypothetical protein IKU15_00345 [Clostridia bacterium]|nr:hypothetical protein [Clostridia bacterium]MBR4889751.1 hypothetical protein [Clostridia bacterium]